MSISGSIIPRTCRVHGRSTHKISNIQAMLSRCVQRTAPVSWAASLGNVYDHFNDSFDVGVTRRWLSAEPSMSSIPDLEPELAAIAEAETCPHIEFVLPRPWPDHLFEELPLVRNCTPKSPVQSSE